jgi:teichuronic acid exporter
VKDHSVTMEEGTESGRPEPEDRGRLVRRAAGSVKWTVLSNLLPRLVTPISTLVLAALLVPADFGIVAVSMLVIALARIVVGLGLGPAVVQRRTMVAKAASAALWMSFAIAAALYGVLWIAAPWIAQIYEMSLVADVIRVSALSLFFFALQSIPTALLQRELGFRKLFWVNSLPQVTTAVVSVSLALLGMGVWALVWGPLAGGAMGAALAWLLCGWRPKLAISRAVVRPLLGFSAWVVGASFQSWLFLYADNAIAGYYLGEEGLGVYSLGFNISQLLPGFVIPALSLVAYPAFCALQSDHREVGRSLLQLQSLATAVLFPACFGLSAIAVPAVALLYGAKWAGLGQVIWLLAIMPGISHLWSLNADAYRAIGRPDVWTKLAGVTLLVLLPLLLLAGPYGLMPFTFVRFGGHFLYPLLNIFVGGRILGISIRQQLQPLAIPMSCALLMYTVTLVLVRVLTPFEGAVGWLKLVTVVAAGASIYMLLLWALSRDLWHRLLLAGRQVLLEA